MLLVGILSSYVLGSIPTAFIFGRIIKGIDIRKFGSGNVGATNVFRVMGPVWGVIVLLLDILKGFVAVAVLANYYINSWNYSAILLYIFFGFVCISGHNWSIFLHFRGGKGVATTLGVLIGLATVVSQIRIVLLLVLVIWVVVFSISRIVSLASLSSAVALPILMLVFQQSKELLIFVILLSLFVIFRHKKNIVGLLSGKEGPLIQRKRFHRKHD